MRSVRSGLATAWDALGRQNDQNPPGGGRFSPKTTGSHSPIANQKSKISKIKNPPAEGLVVTGFTPGKRLSPVVTGCHYKALHRCGTWLRGGSAQHWVFLLLTHHASRITMICLPRSPHTWQIVAVVIRDPEEQR